jgi:hypothetical protein
MALSPHDCLDHDERCSGPVEYRMALSSTGRSFPRCNFHWEFRLRRQQEIDRKYPAFPPHDFDPMDAGEQWDEVS